MQNKTQQIAINYLSRRDYSRLELLQKLQAKNCPDPEIEAVMVNLEQSGLIDDQKFAANFIAQKYNKGYGPQRIRMELNLKGITLAIEEIMMIADNAWLEVLQKIWHKRFKGIPANTFKERAKQYRFLQYRGFTQEQIAKFFDTEFNI